MNSFVETLLIVIGSLIVFGGVIGVLIYFYCRTHSKIYDEMKGKLSPQQFDVWFELQRVESEIDSLERKHTSALYPDRAEVQRLRELRIRKEELEREFAIGDI